MYIYCQRIWYNRRFAQHMHSFHVLHGVLPKKRRIQSKSRQQYDKKNGEELKPTLNLQETLWPILFFGPKMTLKLPTRLTPAVRCLAGLPKRARATWFAFAWWFPIHWTNDFEWPGLEGARLGSFGWKEVNHRNQPWKILGNKWWLKTRDL